MEIQKTALRLPKDLHQLVVSEATKNGHSMNAEIIARLRASFTNSETDSFNEEKTRQIVRDELSRAGISTEKN